MCERKYQPKEAHVEARKSKANVLGEAMRNLPINQKRRSPGHWRKFNYKGLWCLVTSEDGTGEVWIVTWTKIETRDSNREYERRIVDSRKEAFQKLRFGTATMLNPMIAKVDKRVRR